MKIRISTIYINLLIIALFILAGGCRDRHAAELLVRADGVMEETPDSARTLLADIDSTRLRGADLALYAVLDAQSRHKLNMEAPSDTLLNIAVDHYIAHGPDSLLMKALFYRAVGYQERDDLEASVTDLLECERIGNSISQPYWQAKAAELTADLLRDSNNFPEEAEWRQRAFHLYQDAGRDYNALFALSDLAGAFLNQHNSTGCKQVLERLDSMAAEYPIDDQIFNYIVNSTICYHNYYGSDKSLDSLFHDEKVLKVCETQPSLYLMKSELLTRRGQFTESRRLLDSIKDLDGLRDERTMLYHAYYYLAQSSKDFKLMEQATDSLLQFQLQDLEKGNARPVIHAQRNYFQNMVDYQAIRIKKARRAKILYISISLFIIAIAVCIYHMIIRRNKKIMQTQVNQIMAVTNQLQEENRINTMIQTSLEVLEAEKNRLQVELQTSIEKWQLEKEEIKNKNEEIKNKSAREQEKWRSENNELKEKLDLSLATWREDSLHLQEELELSQKMFRNSEEKIIETQSILQNTKEELENLSSKLRESSSRMPEIYRERWTTLNMLCKQLHNKDNVKHERTVTKIKTAINRIKSPEFYDTLENELNRDMDGIVTRLREQYPDLKEKDIQLCIITFANMGTVTIAFLFDTTVDYVYVLRDRLRKRIAKSDSPYKDLFISLLSTTK